MVMHHRLFTSIIVTISLKMKTVVNIAIHVTHCHCVQEWVTLLSPCASLFPSLFLSKVFINMTVIMPPVTKHVRLCQNSLPKRILCSFTRWCPRNLQSFAWIFVNCRGRHRSSTTCDQLLQETAPNRWLCIDYSRQSSWRLHWKWKPGST